MADPLQSIAETGWQFATDLGPVVTGALDWQAEPIIEAETHRAGIDREILGYEDGAPVTSDPESIVWEPAAGVSGHVVWAVNGGEVTEREITWSRAVPDAFLAEIGSNGEDDNGNGLLDEHGLAFTKEGDRVDIYLTVEKLDENGELAQEAETFTVTCRN